MDKKLLLAELGHAWMHYHCALMGYLGNVVRRWSDFATMEGNGHGKKIALRLQPRIGWRIYRHRSLFRLRGWQRVAEACPGPKIAPGCYKRPGYTLSHGFIFSPWDIPSESFWFVFARSAFFFMVEYCHCWIEHIFKFECNLLRYADIVLPFQGSALASTYARHRQAQALLHHGSRDEKAKPEPQSNKTSWVFVSLESSDSVSSWEEIKISSHCQQNHERDIVRFGSCRWLIVTARRPENSQEQVAKRKKGDW